MRLHRHLFWLLIFLLPTQLGRHFWSKWSYVLGLPIDYLSPTIFLTDILVIAILFFWWWQEKKRLTINHSEGIPRSGHLQFTIRKHWWVLAVFIFLLVNSLLAVNRGAAFYKLIKILEFALLGFYIAKSNYTLSAIRYPLSLAVVYSSLIAIFQFVKQASLGRIFWWLGERSFNIMTPGIAKAVVGGQLILRPYATFPHPNVLAGFILVSLILTLPYLFRRNKIFTICYLLLAILAIIISFSRSTWLIGVLIGLGYLSWRWWKRDRIMPVFSFVLASILIICLFFPFFLSLSSQEAIGQRFLLMEAAIKMVKANFISGVGLNNFIPQLPNFWQQYGITYWLQPVHNIYLLTAAEIGLMGLIIFFWFLVLTFKRLLKTKNYLLMTALFVILTTGLLDHYWLTLQQPQLLFSLVLGLSWRR